MPLTTQDRIYIEQRLANEAKSPMVAYLLWFFLGAIGGHRLYLGHGLSALLMAALTIIGIPTAVVMFGLALLTTVAIWWVWDAFAIPTMIDRQKHRIRRALEDELSDDGAAAAAIDTSKWTKKDRQEHERQLELRGVVPRVEPNTD